jgi:hypothetical protein
MRSAIAATLASMTVWVGATADWLHAAEAEFGAAALTVDAECRALEPQLMDRSRQSDPQRSACTGGSSASGQRMGR